MVSIVKFVCSWRCRKSTRGHAFGATRRSVNLIPVYLTLFFILSAGSKVLQAQAGTPTEYEIKAIFIFNFTQFVEWPANAFPDEQTPLVIGVLGDDPFGAYLDETVKGESVNGHSLIVKRFRTVEEADNCHILFINSGTAGGVEQVLQTLKGRSVLTVGDATEFARQGGMVRFFTENKKIRIRINLDATRAADLTISSKLLRLAEIHDSKHN
jgi:hypothetical protein